MRASDGGSSRFSRAGFGFQQRLAFLDGGCAEMVIFPYLRHKSLPSFSPHQPEALPGTCHVREFAQALIDIAPVLLNVLAALAVLIVARIIAGLIGRGLRNTGLDHRIAQALAEEQAEAVKVERYITRGVFYVLMILVMVMFLQVLNFTFATEPLNRFLGAIFEYIPQLIAAGLLVFVAYVVASLLRFLTRRALKAARVDERLIRQVGDEEAAEGADRVSIADTMAVAVYYLVFLLFLPAILDALNLQGLLGPVESMMDEVLVYLPNLLAAVLVGVIGYFIARLIRRIVEGLSSAAGVDRLSERVGLEKVLGAQKLSQVLGLVVYVLVLIPVIIAALNALAVDAVTGPASRMLDIILAAVPQVFAAALLLAIAYVVGRLLAGLVSNLLPSIGFNRFLTNLGLTGAVEEGTRTPADIVGGLIVVAVMLFAAMEASALLGFSALTTLISDFLVFAGDILVGLVIFTLGLYVANLAYRAVRESSVQQAAVLAMMARVAVIVLAGAMALRQMELADSIINLAFGLVLGAIAVAAALAFGLGGREAAR
jgi:hypothetical protein